MRYLVLVLLVLTSCDFMPLYESPDARFTGEWVNTYNGEGFKSSETTLVFKNTNIVTEQIYRNDYIYILEGEYTEFYYVWRVDGNKIEMKMSSESGFVFASSTVISYVYEFSGNKLILNGVEYTKK